MDNEVTEDSWFCTLFNRLLTVKRDRVACVDFIQFYRRGREGNFPISVPLVSPN